MRVTPDPVSVTPRDQPVWWTDIVDQDEIERLDYENSTPAAVIAAQPDLIINVLGGYIFTAEDIAQTPIGIVNLHTAPLPEYRGCNSYAHAIMDGATEYGVSLHYVEPTIDTGPIIDQRRFPIYPHDTGYSLYHRSQMEALTMFAQNVDKLVLPTRCPAVPQEGKVASYYPRNSLDNKSLAGLDPISTERKVRALTFPPFPPAGSER